MTTHITNDHINLDNLDSLIDILGTMLADPDKVATAEKKVRNLQQTKWDLFTYYAEFVCCAAHTTWKEVAKRLQLEESLCHELKNDLITRDEPELFIDFISLLQKLDQKRHCDTTLLPGHKAAPTVQQHMHTYATHTYAYVHAHAPATATTSKAPTGTTTVSGIYPGLMDLSVGRKKLVPEERAYRLAKGHCLYYRGISHVAYDCPNDHHHPHPLHMAEGALIL